MADNRRATDDLASLARQIEEARGTLSGTFRDADVITHTLGIGKEYREAIAAAHGSVLGSAFGQAELGKLASRGVDVGATLRELTATAEASNQISATLRGMTERDEMLRAAMATPACLEEPREFRMPDIPPNPILKTNQLLQELSGEIQEVSSLSAQQIELQNRQVELVSGLLLALAEGSASQEEALKVARRNLWIAVGALIASLALGLAALI